MFVLGPVCHKTTRSPEAASTTKKPASSSRRLATPTQPGTTKVATPPRLTAASRKPMEDEEEPRIVFEATTFFVNFGSFTVSICLTTILYKIRRVLLRQGEDLLNTIRASPIYRPFNAVEEISRIEPDCAIAMVDMPSPGPSVPSPTPLLPKKSRKSKIPKCVGVKTRSMAAAEEESSL